MKHGTLTERVRAEQPCVIKPPSRAGKARTHRALCEVQEVRTVQCGLATLSVHAHMHNFPVEDWEIRCVTRSQEAGQPAPGPWGSAMGRSGETSCPRNVCWAATDGRRHIGVRMVATILAGPKTSRDARGRAQIVDSFLRFASMLIA